jgi:hypothetical protein
MRIEWKKFNIDNKIVEARVSIDERGDRKLIKKLYQDWKNLNDRLKIIGTRGINLPETISENAFCLFFPECVRTVGLKKGKCSFDCINAKTGSRIQIKATSIASDLTSFGPKSEWDELFFLDFSKGDGSFKVYKIEPECIYNHQVNKAQTFQQQQEEKRRPRFSIIKEIIEKRGLKPVKVCKL